TAGSGISGPHWPTWAGLPPPPPLETVTVAGFEGAVLPAPSRARAVSACSPLATAGVAQESPEGAGVSSAPRAFPSSMNWTPAIPLASLAFAASAVVPERVSPSVGAISETEGGVVSLGAGVVTVTAFDGGETLPAAS